MYYRGPEGAPHTPLFHLPPMEKTHSGIRNHGLSSAETAIAIRSRNRGEFPPFIAELIGRMKDAAIRLLSCTTLNPEETRKLEEFLGRFLDIAARASFLASGGNDEISMGFLYHALCFEIFRRTANTEIATLKDRLLDEKPIEIVGATREKREKIAQAIWGAMGNFWKMKKTVDQPNAADVCIHLLRLEIGCRYGSNEWVGETVSQDPKILAAYYDWLIGFIAGKTTEGTFSEDEQWLLQGSEIFPPLGWRLAASGGAVMHPIFMRSLAVNLMILYRDMLHNVFTPQAFSLANDLATELTGLEDYGPRFFWALMAWPRIFRAAGLLPWYEKIIGEIIQKEARGERIPDEEQVLVIPGQKSVHGLLLTVLEKVFEADPTIEGEIAQLAYEVSRDSARRLPPEAGLPVKAKAAAFNLDMIVKGFSKMNRSNYQTWETIIRELKKKAAEVEDFWRLMIIVGDRRWKEFLGALEESGARKEVLLGVLLKEIKPEGEKARWLDWEEAVLTGDLDDLIRDWIRGDKDRFAALFSNGLADFIRFHKPLNFEIQVVPSSVAVAALDTRRHHKNPFVR